MPPDGYRLYPSRRDPDERADDRLFEGENALDAQMTEHSGLEDLEQRESNPEQQENE